MLLIHIFLQHIPIYVRKTIRNHEKIYICIYFFLQIIPSKENIARHIHQAMHKIQPTETFCMKLMTGTFCMKLMTGIYDRNFMTGKFQLSIGQLRQ